MIVVGDKHSANTRRLSEISRTTGTPTFHVETEKDIELDRITEYETVGVTAGASTPQWLIKQVVDKLRRADSRERHRLIYLFRTWLGALLNSGVYIGIGAACMSYLTRGYVVGPQSEVNLPHNLVVVAGLFVMAMHLLSQLMKIDSIKLNEPQKAAFYLRYGKVLYAGAVAAILGAVALALISNWLCGLLIIAGSVTGVSYILLPAGKWKFGRALSFSRLARISGARELYGGLAWIAVVGILPFIAGGMPREDIGQVITACLIVFILVLIRNALLGTRDIEGDQIVGQVTIPAMLGTRKTKRLLFVLLVVLLALVAKALVLDRSMMYGYSMLIAVLCCVLYVILYCARKLPSDELGEAIVDASFILPLLALFLRGHA